MGLLKDMECCISIVLCLTILKGSVLKLRNFLKFLTKLLKLYLLSSLLIYAALGIHVAVVAPLGLFNFSVYIDLNLIGGGPGGI